MQTVTTKYLPSTNTRGSRIKVSSWLGNQTFGYDHSSSCAHKAAFSEWLAGVNDLLKRTHPDVGDYQLVATGSLPDGKGYAFTIK